MGASFEGMEGMEGMTGSLSGVAVSATTEMIFADRIDLPFVTIDDPNGNPIAGQRIELATFPLRNWRADWYSWLVLTEFVGLNWQNFELRPAWAMAGWNSPAAKPMVAGEIDGLVIAAQDERADALGEIVSQADGFISYFLDLLTAPNGYPNTARILTIANLVAGF